MAGASRDRQRKERTAARVAAAEQARRKAAVRRRNIAIGVVGGAALILLFGIIFWQAGKNDDEETTTATDGTSTLPTVPTTPSSAAAESAAGKPCVAVADPLPPGAPAVPIKEGPPPTELIKEDLVVGTGTAVNPGDTVTANYIGVSCSTGKIFDSSYSRGQPSEFPLSGVIPGWTDGIPGMQVGGQRLLGIPAEQAYGANPRPGSGILPDEPLWFVVEIVDTKPTA